MNVLFHVAVGAGIIANSSRTTLETNKDKCLKMLSGFVLGIISHGVLDYVPHCYPINSKIDVIISLSIILIGVYVVKSEWKPVVALILLGSILPDLIDLSPGIINSLLKLNLPVFDHIFPWHYHDYSGSIYSSECSVSLFNHILTIVFCVLMFWINKASLKTLVK